MNPSDDQPAADSKDSLAPQAEDHLGMRALLSLRTCGFVTALLAVAGCAAGPDYHAPKTEVPSGFANATATNTVHNETAVTWWRGFDDARLTTLVELALTNNHDLRVAAAQVREARALRRETQFDLGPIVDTRAGYLNQQFSEAALFGAPVATRHRVFY